MPEYPQTKEQNSYDLVLFLWAHRKLIIGITLLSIVAGVIAAFTIKPLYKSTVVMFPAVTQSPSKSLMNEYASNSEDLLGLGDEEDAEHLLQILSSDQLRDRVTEKFDLFNAYGIKADSKTRISELNDIYHDLILFEYTKFGSVRITVSDPLPERAAIIANYVADQADSVWSSMAHERALKGYELVSAEVVRMEKGITVLEDSMQALRMHGVHDYRTQTERYHEYIGAAILKGDMRAVKELEQRLDTLAKYGGKYVILDNLLSIESNRLSAMRMKKRHAEADMGNLLPHKFIVDRAQPADKKSYPIRWLVVVISAIAGLVFSLFMIIVQATIKKIRSSHAQ